MSRPFSDFRFKVIARLLEFWLRKFVPISAAFNAGSAPRPRTSSGSPGGSIFMVSGGAAVSCLGHGHPRVTNAIIAQARKLAFAHSSFFTNEPAEHLAQFIVERAPAGIERAGIVCDGSEAVEAAIKLARQYWTEI